MIYQSFAVISLLFVGDVTKTLKNKKYTKQIHDMNFSKEAKDKYTIVTSNVEKLDSTNSPELKSELVLINKKSVNNIILDMSKSRYCDSSGLSAILIGNRLCKDSGGKFILTGLQPNVQKLIEISQLQNVLHIASSGKQAEEMIIG